MPELLRTAAHLASGESRIVRSMAPHSFDIAEAKRRLQESGGGYEIVHESPGLEFGVYVLVAPEPDRQQPHADDEVYVVLEGAGELEIEGELVPLTEGQAVFVPAGADHHFTAYEQLAVLVAFSR
jgi:mannose-6-phosphate isomerase-like protein (cupin superfamily)